MVNEIIAIYIISLMIFIKAIRHKDDLICHFAVSIPMN